MDMHHGYVYASWICMCYYTGMDMELLLGKRGYVLWICSVDIQHVLLGKRGYGVTD